MNSSARISTGGTDCDPATSEVAGSDVGGGWSESMVTGYFARAGWQLLDACLSIDSSLRRVYPQVRST